VVPGILINIQDTLKNAGLNVLGEIPLSLEIVRRGLAGKRVYSHSTSDKEIYNFSSVIDTILKEVIHITPLTARYLADETKVTENSTVDEYDDYTFVSSLTVRTVIDDDTDTIEDAPEGIKDPVIETTSSNESKSTVIKETKKNDVSSDIGVNAPKEVITESEPFSEDIILEIIEEE
jgi:hypothetical protein